MYKYKIADIPSMGSDSFELSNCYKMTGVYFWARIDDDGVILDLGYNSEWIPIGITRDSRLLSGGNTCCIMFETKHGERTWFHMMELNKVKTPEITGELIMPVDNGML